MRIYVMVFGTTTYELDHVQNVDVLTGYRNWLEPTSPGTGTVRALYPEGWATPNVDLIIGTQVEVWADFWDVNTSSVETQTLWSGVIQDIQVNYGLPYEAGEGWADEVILTLGAYLSEVANETVDFTPGTKTGLQYTDDLDVDYQITFFMGDTLRFGQDGAPILFPDFVDQARYAYATLISEGAGYATVVPNNAPVVLPVVFSDTTNNAGHQVFEDITTKAATLDYYSRITLDPNNGAPATADSGEIPVVELSVASLSPDSTHALGAAFYILGTAVNKDIEFVEITARSEAQTVPVPSLGASTWQQITGTWTELEFRGETIPFRIIGARMSATPETSLFTYQLTNALNGNYLILDDAQALAGSAGFGALDANRLGF
jgi:hypothetical protein